MVLWFKNFAKYHNPEEDEPLGEKVPGAIEVDDSCKDICMSVSRDGKGVDIRIDNDDVNPREVRTALRRLVDDLCTAGWSITFHRGRG
jgi:hypothetical protein